MEFHGFCYKRALVIKSFHIGIALKFKYTDFSPMNSGIFLEFSYGLNETAIISD